MSSRSWEGSPHDRRRDVDRLIATWLTEIAPEGHVDYLDATLEAIDRIAQRPAWTSPGRWLPMQLTLRRVALPRATPYLAILALVLTAAIVGLVIATGAPRLPAPFGLAATGLVAFESDNGIFVAGSDGTGRREIATGPGVRWNPAWAPLGDRIAFWSAPAFEARASLWVAEPDGSNARMITGGQTFEVPDGPPNITWSPDAQQLAFATSAGVLYVVNRDGTDLRSLGDDARERHGPAWSPDGTLIASRGNPPSSELGGGYVISPDGRTDVQVIAPKGKEITLTPTWSPDGDTIIAHDGIVDLDIVASHRDAGGVWSESVLLAGPTLDVLPAWSNQGTRISFLRLASGAGTNGQTYELMLADADGSNARAVSTTRVGFGFQCWSPDDRFVRTVGLFATDAERSVILIPLDGSPVVAIPAPGKSSSDACPMQRLAPDAIWAVGPVVWSPSSGWSPSAAASSRRTEARPGSRSCGR